MELFAGEMSRLCGSYLTLIFGLVKVGIKQPQCWGNFTPPSLTLTLTLTLSLVINYSVA